jgi:hypothetical protein
MNTRRPWCPCPDKTAFRTEESAGRALARMPVLYGPIAFYRCRCGRWHLTARPRGDEAG